MYPIPPSETLVQTKICRHCQASFPITDKDMEFYEKVSPVFNGKKYLIPTPTLCPDCRQQRRLSFRNERKLYKRDCDATGKSIISIYSPDKPFKVYHQDFWWSDKWDPIEYGKDFDFSRSFFEQFGELIGEVPMSGLMNFTVENCDYTNYQNDSKNCYLTFGSGYLEDCTHCKWVYYSTSVQDASFCSHGENSFDNVDCHYFYKCFHCQGCENMTDCSYCYDCQNCKDCIGCVNLQNKQYYILNKQHTKEGYCAYRDKYDPVQLRTDFEVLKQTQPRKFCMQTGSISCIGSEIKNSKECYYSFDVEEGEGIKYSSDVLKIQDSSDVNNSGLDAYVYEYVSGGYLQNVLFCVFGVQSDHLIYSEYCFSSSHLFGCIGLRNKQYCILNKQYTKEEYETLVPKIIEHMMKSPMTPLTKGGSDGGAGGFEWGEFFPSSLSPFGYNETVAQEYYPLTREEALSLRGETEAIQDTSATANLSEKEDIWPGSPRSARDDIPKGNIFNWSDYEAPFPKAEKIIPADKLPDDITKIPDDILNWAIECEVTKKPFRIIQQELEFYRKHNLPIPRRHPDQRYLDRMALRNPRKLFERLCDCPSCEENNRKKGVVLNETNSGYKEDSRLHGNDNDKNTPLSFGGEGQGVRRKKMITTYGPERPERVYCEECYNTQVIW